MTHAAQSKERMGGFIQTARYASGPALGLLAILFALALSRCQLGIGHTTFDYMSQARWLLDGGGLAGLTSTQPPGYTLIWLLFLNLPNPLLAGFVLSLLSQALTVWCVYALLARATTDSAARLGAFLVAINGALAGSADYVWVEAPFTASLIGGWLAFEQTMGRVREPREFGKIAAAALLAVLPLYLRYAAAPVLAVMVAWALYTAFRRRRRDLALYAGLIILLALPLPVLNWLVEGIATGHPLDVTAAQDFWSSLFILARELGSTFLYVAPTIREAPLFNLTNADGTAMRLPILAALLGAIAILFPIALALLTRRGPLLRIGLAVLAYVLFYALVASQTRIDRLSLRFLVPIVPLAIAGCVMAAPILGRWGGLLLGGTVVGFGLVGLLQGLAPDRYGYAPATIAYVAHNFPPGSALLTNAFGRQLDALAPGYKLVPLPYDDPFNDGFSEAYGIAPWSEAELDQAITQNHARALVILLGPDGDDPYLDFDAYGDAVARLLADPAARITRLPDGMVVSLP